MFCQKTFLTGTIKLYCIVLYCIALQNPRKKELDELSVAMADLAAQANVTLQWIPAHGSIHGNKTADKLAKEGGQLSSERHTSNILR